MLMGKPKRRHMRQQDKTILVTAAVQGIGWASVLACARQGAHFMATDIGSRLLAKP